MPRSLKIAPSGDRDVVVAAQFDTEREALFRAHTDPDFVDRWLPGPLGWPMTVCEIDLRAGGSFRYVWSKSPQETLEAKGVYREVAAPMRIVHAESSPAGDTVVTTVFTERPGIATVLVTALDVTMAYPTAAARDAAVAAGITDRLTRGYQRLDAVLMILLQRD